MNTSFANETGENNKTLPYIDTKSCYNALAWRLILTSYQSYAIGICITLITVPTIFINVALLIGLIRTKQPGNTTSTYIKLTAISGFLNGITGQPLYILLFTVYSKNRFCALEMASVFVVQFNTHMLGYTILLLAIDRLFCVFPTTDWCTGVKKWMVSRHGSVVMISVVTIVSILHGLFSTNCFGFKKVTILNVSLILMNCILALTVYIAYFRLYFKIRRHVKELKAMDALPSRRNAHHRKHYASTQTPNYLHEFVKTITIILVAGFICYIPFILMDFWTGWYTYVEKTAAPLNVRFCYYLFVVPIFIYSPLNAILLLYRNTKACTYVANMTSNRLHMHWRLMESPMTSRSTDQTPSPALRRDRHPLTASPLKNNVPICTIHIQEER